MHVNIIMNINNNKCYKHNIYLSLRVYNRQKFVVVSKYKYQTKWQLKY